MEIVEVFVLSGFFDVFQKIFKFFVVPHCKTGSQRFVIIEVEFSSAKIIAERDFDNMTQRRKQR